MTNVQELVTVDVEDGLPDWAYSANDIVEEEVVRDEVGVDLSECPRYRRTVLHDSYGELGVPDEVVRIECRVGDGYGDVHERYDVSGLEDNPFFIRSQVKDDVTYVNFYFELSDGLQEVVDLVKEQE